MADCKLDKCDETVLSGEYKYAEFQDEGYCSRRCWDYSLTLEEVRGKLWEYEQQLKRQITSPERVFTFIDTEILWERLNEECTCEN